MENIIKIKLYTKHITHIRTKEIQFKYLKKTNKHLIEWTFHILILFNNFRKSNLRI